MITSASFSREIIRVLFFNFRSSRFFIYIFVPFRLILIFLITLKTVRTYGREEEIRKGDRRLCLREKGKVSSIVFWIGYPRSTWNFHFRRCMVLWQPLCHIHVGAALNNDGYFHILYFQHLFIIRTLSSSHFPLSGFLCFFFLCVCVCVCVLFFFYYYFFYRPSMGG